MRLQVMALGVSIGMGLCVPSVSSAQSTPTPGGTLAIEPKRQWNFGARLTGYYDSNIARSDAATAAARNIEREDYVLTPEATISVVQPIGRQALFVNGSAGYEFHRENPRLDRQRVDVQGGVVAVIGRLCQHTATTGYRASQSDLTDLSLGVVENEQKVTNVALRLQCARPVGPGFQVSTERSDTKNSATRLELADVTSETTIVAFSYARPSLGNFNVSFLYSDVEFPNRINPGRPVGDGFFTQSYRLGYERKFGARLNVRAMGGITHLKREFAPPGVEQSFNSRDYSGDVTYRLGTRVELQLLGLRQLSPSQQVGKTFDKRTTAEALARYQAGRRLRLTTGYRRTEIRSNVDTALALMAVTNSDTDSVYGSALFSLNDTLQFTLDVRHDERKTNLPEFNYTSTRVGLTAQAKF